MRAPPPFFKLPAAELTDTCVDVELLPAAGRPFAPQLRDARTAAQQLHHLTALLRAALPPTRGVADARIADAVAAIRAAPHRVSLAQVQADGSLSERSFQRRFKHAVGITPQLFARICRFQASLHQLRGAGYAYLV